MSVEARSGYHCFLTFTDDLSGYGHISLMKHKSETFEKFKEFQSEVENHRPRVVRVLNAEVPSARHLDRIFRNLNRREYDSINRVLVTLPLSDLQGYEDALPSLVDWISID